MQLQGFTTYLKDDQYWSYKVRSDVELEIEKGTLQGGFDNVIWPFNCRAELDKWLRKNITRCVKLGFKLAAESVVESKSDDALLLGQGVSIVGVHWVDRFAVDEFRDVGRDLRFLKEYDPNGLILVEVLNRGIVSFFLLSKKESWILVNAERNGTDLKFEGAAPSFFYPEALIFISKTRSLLRRFSHFVRKRVKKAGYEMGNLSLFDGVDVSDASMVRVFSTEIGEQVQKQFRDLGDRVLSL
jgi:hypothetical protein